MRWLLCYLAAWALLGLAIVQAVRLPVFSVQNAPLALLVVGCLALSYSALSPRAQ